MMTDHAYRARALNRVLTSAGLTSHELADVVRVGIGKAVAPVPLPNRGLKELISLISSGCGHINSLPHL
jgi:hypothetical protein